MRGPLVGFCFGVASAHALAYGLSLVSPVALAPLWSLVPVAVGFGVIACLLASSRTLGTALLGFAYAAMAVAEPALCDGDVRGSGVVVSIVAKTALGQRFLFEFDEPEVACRRVRLNYYGEVSIRAGEKLDVSVRLRPARGLANPAGFDMERWYRATRIDAIGTLDAFAVGAHQHAGSPLDGLRQWVLGLREELSRAIDRRPLVHGDVIKAVTVGDDSDLDVDTRERFRGAGAIHLLVVSGLHIAVVATLGFALARPIAMATGFHPAHLGVTSAVLIAGIYVVLAGAGLPILRAYAMTVVVLVGLVAGRRLDGPNVLLTACAAVFVIDPLALLDVGFWLSFGAVACLTAFFRPRLEPVGGVGGAWRGQFVMSTAFVPSSAFLLGVIAPLGFVGNLLVVPLISLVVVPLALLGVVAMPWTIGDAALVAADFSIAVAFVVLGWFESVELVRVAGSPLVFVVLAFGATLMLAPVSRTVRALVTFSIVALLTADRPTAMPYGHFRLHVLDVGQGLAVAVETHGHALLYDAGGSFRGGGDMADFAVLPALEALGVLPLDVFMLSHDDDDHAGGAPRLLAELDVARFVAGPESALTPLGSSRCLVGDAWVVDGVEFRVVHDGMGASASNDRSCVLFVTSVDGRRALLPGDVEAWGEAQLMAALDVAGVGDVTLLLMPHHGSRTSSSDGFVARTRPRIAVAAAGFRNRFGHPHATVVERYARRGVHVVEMAETGGVTWRSDQPGRVAIQRCSNAPYWRHGRLVLPCARD